MQEFYDEVYQAWAISLQFPENIFDRVCSFDLVGHIPVNQKNDVFREINRVLKTDGISFNYIEIDAPKGIIIGLRNIQIYIKKYFIIQD